MIGAQWLQRARAGAAPRVVIDSREVRPGDLFVALPGEHVDGARFVDAARAAGAWEVLVGLDALQDLARAWRRELDAEVIGITGSVGKTSTKDLLRAMLAPHRRVHASRANFNTEIGLPLELLRAPADTEVLVLEMGMRGAGQIAELAAIAEPGVGVITAIGAVHLELLGSIEAIAQTKAELIQDVRVAVIPADEPLLEPHLPAGVEVVRFRDDIGDLELGWPGRVPAHMRRNAAAALAAARAVGVEPSGRVEVELSAMRGQVREHEGVTVVDDCYNANPLSMRAALDDLAQQDPAGRRIAVLGDMLELGPTEVAEHEAVGAHAAGSGVDVLVTVGPLAAAMAGPFGGEAHVTANAAEAAPLVRSLVRPGDLVLVKASRGVALEAVTQALTA